MPDIVVAKKRILLQLVINLVKNGIVLQGVVVHLCVVVDVVRLVNVVDVQGDK